jgi:aldose sugar dehydrogenase
MYPMKRIVVLLALLLIAGRGSSQHYATRIIKDKLFIPWEIIYGPDNHIWFTQKNGYVCRLDPVSKNLDTLLYEPENVIVNEGGMLGMALHPDFPATPYVYIAYEYNKSGSYTEKVVRYSYTGSALTSAAVLLDNIKGASIHNGCRLLIVDNKLYISTGDAATPSNGQNLSSVNGKTLRINLDGSIPADNPITGSPVWNWGQRNVQGMVFANDRIYSSMHGASADDEINILVQGRNYGWPTVEGICDKPAEITFCADSNVVEPLYTWTPTIAPAGLDYYDHPMFPDLQKSLIMATLKDSKLYQLKLNGTFDDITTVTVIDSIKAGRLRDICISPNGSIFVSTSNSGASGTGAHTDKIIELYDPAFAGIGEMSIGTGIIVSPNPAGTSLDIRIEGRYPAGLSYHLLDMKGSVVMQGALPSGGLTLNISNLAAGIYLLRSTASGYSGKPVRIVKY